MPSITYRLYSRRKGSKRGFTLVELIIAIVICLILGGILVTLLANYITFFVHSKDRSLAAQRANNVITLLRTPVQNVGLGIPNASPDVMERAFGWSSGSTVPIWSWSSLGNPIDAIAASHDAACFLYSLPLGIKTKEAYEIPPAGGKFFVEFLDDMPAGRIPAAGSSPNVSPYLAKNWVAFLGNAGGFTVGSAKGASGKLVEVEFVQPTNLNISKFSDVQGLMAAVAFVDKASHTFYLADVGGSGETMTKSTSNTFASFMSNPSVSTLSAMTGSNPVPIGSQEGIVGVKFELDGRKLLKIRVLARGEDRNLINKPSYDPNFVKSWDLTESDTEYILEEASVQWRMRNLEEAN